MKMLANLKLCAQIIELVYIHYTLRTPLSFSATPTLKSLSSNSC